MYNIAAMEKAIASLAKREKTTKAAITELSRSVLEAVIDTKDSRIANKFVNALTPVNRKVVILYLNHFLPFHFSKDAGAFGKMHEKEFDTKAEAIKEWLEDPHNNVWSWADREVEIEKKPFDLAKVTKSIEGFIKKAEKAKVSQKDLFKAILAGGLDVDTLIECINEMSGEAEAE